MIAVKVKQKVCEYSSISDLSTVYKQHGLYIYRHIDASEKIVNFQF